MSQVLYKTDRFDINDILDTLSHENFLWIRKKFTKLKRAIVKVVSIRGEMQ